jgi:protein-disulfide isomerase
MTPRRDRGWTFAASALCVLSLGAWATTQPDLRLKGAGFERGDPRAPLSVVEFGDLSCSACAQFAVRTLPAIDSEFVRTGQVHWTFVPFVLGVFPNSGAATAAAVCAGEQGAFWPMHDRLYGHQERWSRERDPRASLRALALESGVDAPRFDRCYGDGRTRARVDSLTSLARSFSINATPTFLVGGRRVRGALPADSFRTLLLNALRR